MRRLFGPKDVEKIIVHGSQVTVDHVGWPYSPQGLTSAQLNLPYCIATFLLEGDAFVTQFTEDKVADPARIELSRRVEVIEDQAITALGSRYRHKVRVEIRLKNGEVHEETVEARAAARKSSPPIRMSSPSLESSRAATSQIRRPIASSILS
jgi:aconitate decarboxylase